MQIHNVFCLSFETLSRVLCALRLNLPPPAQLINGLPTYLVRRLMEVRRGRRLQRFVNWEGYMLEEPSWVPQSAILDKTMLRDNHPDKPGGSPEGSCLGATLTVLKSFCASLSLSVKCVVCLCVCLPPLHHTWSNRSPVCHLLISLPLLMLGANFRSSPEHWTDHTVKPSLISKSVSSLHNDYVRVPSSLQKPRCFSPVRAIYVWESCGDDSVPVRFPFQGTWKERLWIYPCLKML